MAKKKASAKIANKKRATRKKAASRNGNGANLFGLTSNDAKELVENASLFRREMLSRILDPRRDIDKECGYPTTISTEQYKRIYDREGVGRRVVQIFPEESWAVDPEIIETKSPDETEFEKAWEEIQKKVHLFHFMHRVDELSGIGRFGVLFLGFNDGKDFKEPIEPNESIELMYVRAFDEDVVTVDARESDLNNERFGKPTVYTLDFEDLEGNVGRVGRGGQGEIIGQITRAVHWTRIIHVADNRKVSEVFGTPRMQPVFNRILDIRKVLSGSGEMFWKGAFPGYSFEVNPNLGDAVIDSDALRKEFSDYANGLQRYLALTGVTAKSLAPQVADPSAHVATIMENIAVTLGIPKRKFLGSEQAQLASVQDSRTWNKRLLRRQTKYLTPMLVRPLIDRLIEVQVLPEPTEYFVIWPDLNTTTDDEKAKVGKTRTEALALYASGNVDQFVPPAEFMKIVLGMEHDEVVEIMGAAKEFLDLEQSEEEERLFNEPLVPVPPVPRVPPVPVPPVAQPPTDE